MPSLAIAPILKAMKSALAQPTEANIFALADAANLTIKKESLKIEVVEHTTKKGKVIKGVVRTDLSYAEAKAIDEYTFKKDGGWFIREKHLGVDTQNESVEQASTVMPQNEPVTTLQSDTLVKDEDNNIKGLERKFKPASKKYKNPEINLEPKESAKLLKKTLTKLFPDTKFKVGIARGTAYGSVNVSWTDGASRELVKVIAEHFKGSRFNSSDDSTVYLHSLNEDGKIVDYKLSYIGLSRTYTREFLEKIKAAQHINMDGVVIVEENNSVWFKVDNEESEYTESVLNRAKALSSTSKYNFGNVPQAENDESEDFTLSSQSEAERLAKENEIKLIEQQKREAEEKARLKAQADKELNDFRLSGSSLPSDVAASYGQGDMFVTTRKQKQMPSLMQDATGLDPAIKDMVKEYYDLVNGTYVDEKLADPTLENWERKEYQQVKDDNIKRKDELAKHLNEKVLKESGIDWTGFYKQLSPTNEAPPTYTPTSVTEPITSQETLKRQALKLEDVLLPWKPRFKWSTQPEYERMDANKIDVVFNNRGDLDMLKMTASITVNGKEPPAYAVEKLKRIRAAQQAGYEMKKVKIKSDVGIIFVKNGMVLTNDGVEKLLSVDKSIYDNPEIPNKVGYLPIIAAQVNIAKSFVKWLQTYGDSDDLATITKRLKETGFFDKFQIARADNDKSTLELRYRDDVKKVPLGGAAYTAKVSKRGDWLDLKEYIYQLAGVNLADYDDNGDSKIKGQKGLWFVINDFNQGENNVPSTSNAMESDSDNTIGANQQQSVENGNDDESAKLGRMARPPVNGLDARGGSERDSSTSLSEDDGIGIGTRGDTVVSDRPKQRGARGGNTTTQSSRGSRTNEPRTPNERSRDSAIVRTSTRAGSVTQNDKEAAQLKAEGTPTQWGDVANIDKALPYLLPEQRDDVAKVEKRLIEDNKNGMLFTNGTGTGKTFTGLGAVKRFANAGKKNILIVSMNDKIIRDFVKSAKALNLDIHHLDGVTDNGKDKIVATTYANLAQNLMLGKRDWDLIVVDEAHNLMQGEKGENTNALAKLRALSGHHAGFHEWVKMRHAEKDPKPIGEQPETGEPIYDQDQLAEWAEFKKPLREQWKKTWAEQPKGRTKVIFLTATPFSYVKTLDWAEGYLFDFVPPAKKFSNDTEAMGAAYNSGSEYERFYMSNFGYKMRTNRLTRPDGRVDVGILERKFAEKLKTEGAMSGRDLSVPFDYDRKFVLIDSKIGEKIDEGFSYLWDTKDKDGKSKYSDLLRVLNKRFDYLARLQLLEAIKAQEAIEQIKKHIALGRKVIVFHDYNEGGGSNPFVYVGGATQNDVGAVESQYEDFKRARPDLIALDLDLDAPITTLRRSFPDALLYNGRVAKGQRSKNADLFNTDSNGHNVLIAQSDAAATGISFHDTTGAHQRVIINIGMPSKPAKLRQTEGRIYRVGQASNAIQRYLTTGTNWERSTFSQKIAERAETVDNLAQGESAVVSIKDALVQAYEEAEYFEPSENDGIGGKAYDEENARINKLTPFERAKSDYWVKQKVTAKRQDREGKEWYATPEPVGLFMVNLSGAHSGDDILEPSAGDGAIGRYMPSDASVTFIEPSESLASRARMNNTNANVIVDDFESHGSNNKYDSIVMNPPFGQGGSIAIKHLVKAFEHLRDGGRVVALLPVGKMDELIAKYRRDGYFEDIYTVAEFALPSSTFKNAGTAVNTKIYVFERHDFKADAPRGVISKNLSHYDDIEDLFDAIENINIKPRKPRIDEALAEYGLEIYPDRSKYIITGEGLKRKDITSRLFGSYIEKNKDGDVVEKYNRSIAYLKWLKDSQIPNMAQFNNGLSANNLPIKYQGQVDKYDTWDGLGSMPDWLLGAINYHGKKLEDFAVEKPVYDAVGGIDPQAILAAMRQALDVPSDENIQALADVAGLSIKKPSPTDFTLSTYTEADLRAQEAVLKAAEAKRQAEEKSSKKLTPKATESNSPQEINIPQQQTKTITIKVPVSANSLSQYAGQAYGNLSLLTERDFLNVWKNINAANYMLRNSIEVSDAKNGNRHVLSQSGKPELVKLVNDELLRRGLDKKYTLFVERKEQNNFDDIGSFNFTPAIDFNQTLKAIKETLANGSYDNIKRLAMLTGLTLKQAEPDIELDMFGDPIQSQGFDLFGDPIQDGDDSPVEELPRLAVVELPLSKLSLSEDVPQFKSGADDESGVVEALGGKFDRTGVAPIQVWERADGRLEIISGRHRTDLARRSGEKTIPAQVHKESEGFTAKQAMMLDAELNIRDGQGKVKDYVDYFTHSEISEDEAERRGLIARHIGQRAFTIASKGSEELKTLHRNEIISDQAAAEIANIAPSNSAMQAVGLRVLQEHKPLNNALNTIRAVMALTREKGQEPDTFDLFGFDDSALKEAEAMARIASRKQRQIAEQLNAIKGAVKNPKLAAKHGVVVENEADALAKVQAMTAQKARWDNWSSYADLLAEVRNELNNKLDSVFDEDDYYWLCQEELVA